MSMSTTSPNTHNRKYALSRGIRAGSFGISDSSPLSELSRSPTPPTPPSASNLVSRRDRPAKCYRKSRLIPPHLRDTIKIILEEELYASGIELLTSLVTQGLSTVSYGTGQHKEVFVPPTIYLQLCTTLVVHPAFTTHILKKEKDHTGVPKLALRYLKRVSNVVGAKALKAAWTWESRGSGGRGGRRNDVEDWDDLDGIQMMLNMDDDDLDLKIAKGENLFALSEDLWTIVGWGFTCSVLHSKRWKWWKLLLEVMIEVMERDWEERLKLVGRSGSDTGSNTFTSPSTPTTWKSEEGENIPEELKGALILKYLATSTRGSAAAKRVIRAIFANGKGRSAGEWKEIFPGETDDFVEANRKKKELHAILKEIGSRKKKPLDPTSSFMEELDAEDDYDEDTDENLDSSDKMDVDLPFVEPPDPAVLEWGGIEALTLRHRLLILLSSTSFYTSLPLPIEDLYPIYKDHILPLPLNQFTLFTLTMPSLNPTLASYRSSLYQLLVESLLSSQAPDPPETDFIDEVALTECYLPYPANTTNVQDNAKVAVLMEGLVRVMGSVGVLSWNRDLKAVVEKGVKIRWEKCRLKVKGDEEGAKGLKESGRRLMMMLEEVK